MNEIKEKFGLIKSKTIKNLTFDEYNLIKEITEFFELSNKQKDVICLALMFEENVECAFKKATIKNEV